MKSIIKQWVKVLAKFASTFITPESSEVLKVYASEFYSAETLWGTESASYSRPRLFWKTSKYLFLRKNFLVSPSENFNSSWYLEQNSDVACSNVHPLLHFIQSGRFEGRLPLPNRTVYLDELLWRGNSSLAITKLQRLLVSDTLSINEKLYAYWALARWHRYLGDSDKAFTYVKRLMDQEALWDIGNDFRYRLLCIDCATQFGAVDTAQLWIEKLFQAHPEAPEAYIAKINLLQASSSLTVSKWETLFNNIYRKQGLDTVSTSGNELSISSLSCSTKKCSVDGPRVSVIVPLFNCADTIEYVLTCLDQQSWTNLETIIVNDQSSDASASVVQEWLNQQPSGEKGRIWRFIESEANVGAYGVRNLGMAAATGEYLTVNDADDWAHGQKIELQVNALLNTCAEASVSSMIRTLPNLSFHCWRIDDRWVFRNVSSLLIKRSVLEDLGYWDEIKAGADTEYYYRILKKYGTNAIAHAQPEVPLSLQLIREGSLTQNKDTHAVTQFEGPRKWYLDAAFRWHSSAFPNLYMERRPKVRPFTCPASLCSVISSHSEVKDIRDEIVNSGLWDAAWYVQRYKDLQDGGIEPLEHFVLKGRFEGRDPGPRFSCSGYSYIENISFAADPFVHFLRSAKPNGYLPTVKGDKIDSSGANVLLVGHQAGKTLYGAERSLIDLARAFNIAEFNVFILLPEALNGDYIAQLKALSVEVRIIPFGWWYEGKRPVGETVAAIKDYIAECQIQALHINTLVLDEAIVSAKQMNVPFIVHVREDLPSDPALEETLLSSAERAHSRLIESGAKIVCNSQYLLKSFCSVLSDTKSFNGSLIYNAIDTDKLISVSSPSCDTLQVGLISSNVAKKGVRDFFEIADLLKNNPLIQFKVYGQNTSELERCFASCTSPHIKYCGYVTDPKSALDNLHVVLNLSHFNESFGRTIAEAQAAGKVAIGYNTGALPELIQNGRTGFTVPFRQLTQIKAILERLASSPEEIKEIGQRAKSSAIQRFSHASCSKALLTLYTEILEA